MDARSTTRNAPATPGVLVTHESSESLPRWNRGAWLALAVLGLLLGLFRAEGSLGDSDVLWGARGGLDMLATGHVPHLDYYSWTVPGKAWIPNSWGWNLVLGVTYRVGAIRAIFLLGIVLTALLCLVVGWAAARIGADPARTFMVLAVLGMLMRFPLYARPQFVDYLMVFALPPLVRIALRDTPRQALGAAIVLWLVEIGWMNLHTSAVLGPVIVAAAGVGVIARHWGDADRTRIISRLVGLTITTAACCLATPYGTSLITHVGEVRRASVGYIKEWAHAGFSGSGPIFAVVAIGLGLIAASLALRARRYETTGVLLVLCAATAYAIRFTPMVVLFAVPEYAVIFGRVKLRPVMAKRIAALGALTIVLLVASGLSHFAKPGNDAWSPRLVGALPPGCRTLNDYGIGGEILLTRPDVRVSWDGRNDLYGWAVELQVDGYLNDRPGTTRALDAAGVNCVLTNTRDPIVSALSKDPAWRMAGTEGSRTLLLRTQP